MWEDLIRPYWRWFLAGHRLQVLQVLVISNAEFLCWLLHTGITVDKFGLIYFVDGTMIRRIDQNGIISTLLGSNDLTSARPLSCDSVMDISQVRRLCLLEPCVCALILSSATQPAGHLSLHCTSL